MEYNTDYKLMKAQLEALMKQSAEHASYVANRTLTKARKRLGYVNL